MAIAGISDRCLWNGACVLCSDPHASWTDPSPVIKQRVHFLFIWALPVVLFIWKRAITLCFGHQGCFNAYLPALIPSSGWVREHPFHCRLLIPHPVVFCEPYLYHLLLLLPLWFVPLAQDHVIWWCDSSDSGSQGSLTLCCCQWVATSWKQFNLLPLSRIKHISPPSIPLHLTHQYHLCSTSTSNPGVQLWVPPHNSTPWTSICLQGISGYNQKIQIPNCQGHLPSRKITTHGSPIGHWVELASSHEDKLGLGQNKIKTRGVLLVQIESP